MKDGEECTALTFSCVSELQTLNVESNCDWACDTDFENDGEWFYVVPSNGFGDQTIGVFVLDNPSSEPRQKDLNFTGLTDNGTIIVKTVSITQEAATGISVEPANFVFGPQASYKPAYLKSLNIGSWGVSAITDSWCNITPRGGVGNATVEIRVSRNIGAARSADIILTGVSSSQTATIHVQQRGPFLEVAPTSVRLEGATDFTSVTVDCNTVWSAATNANWCSVTPSLDRDPEYELEQYPGDSEEYTRNRLMIFAKDNRGDERTCTVTLRTCDGSNIVRTITVTQEKSQGSKIDAPNVYLMAASKTGLTFGWDVVEGADSYDVYFDLTRNLEAGAMPTRVMDSYSGTAITFTSLTSYLVSTNDDRASVLNQKVLAYTPEDS